MFETFLNDSLIRRLESKNCCENGCLIRNVGSEDGWTVLRPTATKNKQTEIQAEAQAKNHVSKAEKNGRKLKQITLKMAKLFCSKSS